MSTRPERGKSTGRSVIEPTHIERRRRSESLAELLRQVREKEGMTDEDEDYESIAAPTAAVRLLPDLEEDETEELPPVPAGEDYMAGVPRTDGADGPATGSGRPSGARPGGAHGLGRDAGLRRAAITVAVVAAALIGFAFALLVPGANRDDASPAGAGVNPSTAPAARAPAGATDPDGAGTLREGDSGPEVTALQQRLLHIPNVYDHGSTSGTYDATLAAAVARFQVWYGVRGDESGVYGNDTRADLESRTAAP
ncbi:peptidoglycan-binding protein [Streptomyces rhizosphaerihabitans]|uniref:peptidoglycan-binding protein n=1 Tax=Streptomyces rhizosphaerihabitans TaxID=1266770 RepID=UPI0021BEF285|nr:peptidoglycan-binding protein [Streptomyces rhizosphaerihabitans]MCT9007967.1 peptidoglycan-binding protein [Streptomyces rhizosphaerihabitans]